MKMRIFINDEKSEVCLVWNDGKRIETILPKEEFEQFKNLHLEMSRYELLLDVAKEKTWRYLAEAVKKNIK